MLRILPLLVLLTASPPLTPDPHLTPGDSVPVSIEQLCTPGYARGARNVSSHEKRMVFERYGLVNTGHVDETRSGRSVWHSDFEIDHLVSLELGGSNAIENLWPESYLTQPWNARAKDRLENTLHRMVCAGQLPLDEAQREISTNWIDAYRKYVEGTQ